MNVPKYKSIRESLGVFINHPYVIIDENNKMIDFQGKIDDLMDSEVYEVNQDILDLLHKDIQRIISPLLKITKIKTLITESDIFPFEYNGVSNYIKITIKPLKPITDKDEYIIIFEGQKLDNAIFSQYSLNSTKHKDRKLKENIENCSLNVKEYVKNLEEANKFLELAKEKSEAADNFKSEFLANMSHEIRIPLNAIIGFAELISNEEMPVKDRIEYLNIVKNSGNALLNLMDDVINISLIESGKFLLNNENCRLNAMLSEIHSFYDVYKKENQKKHIRLHLNVANSDENFTILTDAKRLHQVISNFITNSFRNIETGYIEFGYSFKDAKTLLFRIKDTGQGTKKELQSVIFDRPGKANIKTTKLYEGSGLGLTISKNIIELLGGEVWVDSVYGEGTTFYFTIPYKPVEPAKLTEKTEPKKKKKKAKSEYIWQNKTVLVVEDTLSNYLFINSILKKTKVKVLWAQDGEQAVEVCRLNSNIDAILMDIQLPKLDGLEATRQIRKFKPNLPIIAQTAFVLAGEQEKSLKAGCNDYISKPINQKNLLNTLNQYL